MKSSSLQKDQPSVIIVGDEPLVDEYSGVISAFGYAIVPLKKIKGVKTGGRKISIALELSNLDLSTKKQNLEKLDKALPESTLILTSSVNVSALEQSQWIKIKRRLVGIAALPTLIRNSVVEVSPTIYTSESAIDGARNFFNSLKKEIAIVQDRVGMVLPRILCQIINEAMFAVQQDVALPKDIDTAMRLGTNYPSGPIEWGEKIGFKQVTAVLTALHADLGEERYRICPLLKEIAVTGKFWG